ncbi:MAG: radical SAM protein [Syntrophales bacterium LBB04]|nr:radical SAM protein [Syntrophales bacterium LBB04]
MPAAETLEGRLQRLKGMLKRCILCPRRCRIDRTGEGRGFCGLPADVVISRALAHHGEEPPISGTGGAGTVFLSSCNLKCVFCQNHQISTQAAGRFADTGEIARIMLDLQYRGCHNIELVTPTPQLPGLTAGLLAARRKGLTVPVVYNCGGYEDPQVLRLLEGIVDIYLPDFKFGDPEDAFAMAGAEDYPRYALEAIREMVRQVGEGLDVDHGIARRGVLVRHLILPGRWENSRKVLALIKSGISTSLTLSLMSQYTPVPMVRDHCSLGRRVTKQEYERVVEQALAMGFADLFIQDVDDRALAPDFEKESPFRWEA